MPLHSCEIIAKTPAISLSAKKVLKIEPAASILSPNTTKNVAFFWQPKERVLALPAKTLAIVFFSARRNAQWRKEFLACMFLPWLCYRGSIGGSPATEAASSYPPPFGVSYVIISRSTQSNTQHVGCRNQSGVGDSPWRTVPLPPYTDSWRQQSAPPLPFESPILGWDPQVVDTFFSSIRATTWQRLRRACDILLVSSLFRMFSSFPFNFV